MHPLEISGNTKLFASLLIGILFGFILVKSALSNRKTFMDQFTFKDNSFAIIFFISITVGVPVSYFLTKYGIINLHPSNYRFWPIVVGAILTGIGLVLCGHIPITAVASFGTGKLYSIIVLLGMLAAFPVIKLIDPILSDYVFGEPDPVDVNALAQNSLFYQGKTTMLYLIPAICLVLALFLRLIQRGSSNKSKKKEE